MPCIIAKVSALMARATSQAAIRKVPKYRAAPVIRWVIEASIVTW